MNRIDTPTRCRLSITLATPRRCMEESCMAKSNLIKGRDYKNFLREIKQRVHRAQYDALKVVNKELIALYWDIGRMILNVSFISA